MHGALEHMFSRGGRARYSGRARYGRRARGQSSSPLWSPLPVTVLDALFAQLCNLLDALLALCEPILNLTWDDGHNS